MKTLMIALALALPAAAQESRPASGVAVTLADGSTLVSTSVEDAIVLRTAYGDQTIPLRDIRIARRLPSGSLTLQARGLSITGDLVSKEVELHTSIGPLKISSDEIRALSALNGSRGLLDEATTALWWFGDGENGTCRDLVKGRPFAIGEFDVTEDAAGIRGLVRRKPNSIASVPSDDDLELLEEDYTLELRFRMPAQPRAYVALLYKCNPNDGTYDYMVTIAANGQIGVSSARNGNGMTIATPSLRRNAWNTLTIVQKAQPACCNVYLNGTLVLAQNGTLMPFGGAVERAIHFGAPPRMGGTWEAPEAVQFLRLSKVARQAEEIAELEKGWDSILASGGAARGVHLRDGSFLRGELQGLGAATFLTRYGTLKLSEKLGGELQLYKRRLQELDGVRAEVARLIPLLGSGGIAEREATAARVIALGEVAVPVLREADPHGDLEIQGRITLLLKKFDETGASKRPVCDVLRLGDMTVQGWLDCDPVVLSTRRGVLRLSPAQVERINLGRRDSWSRPLLHLAGGDVLEFTPADGAKAELTTAFGRMTVPLEECKELAYSPEKKQWTLTAERLSATGLLSGTASMDTPLGPLILPLSELRTLRPLGKPAAPQAPILDENQ